MFAWRCPGSACRRGRRGRPPAQASRETPAAPCKHGSVSSVLSSFGLLGGAAALLQIGDPFGYGPRLSGRQLAVALVVLHRLCRVLQEQIVQNSDVEMGMGAVRIELEGPGVIAARLVEPALASRHHAELVVVDGAVGIEADRLLQRFDGLLRAPGAGVENAEVRARAGEARLAACHGEPRP